MQHLREKPNPFYAAKLVPTFKSIKRIWRRSRRGNTKYNKRNISRNRLAGKMIMPTRPGKREERVGDDDQEGLEKEQK